MKQKCVNKNKKKVSVKFEFNHKFAHQDLEGHKWSPTPTIGNHFRQFHVKQMRYLRNVVRVKRCSTSHPPFWCLVYFVGFVCVNPGLRSVVWRDCWEGQKETQVCLCYCCYTYILTYNDCYLCNLRLVVADVIFYNM